MMRSKYSSAMLAAALMLSACATVPPPNDCGAKPLPPPEVFVDPVTGASVVKTPKPEVRRCAPPITIEDGGVKK